MSEESKVIENFQKEFQPFWSAEETKGIDRSFSVFDIPSKISISITEQDYVIYGEGKTENVKAETVTEAISKSSIKSVDKIYTALSKKNAVYLASEITKTSAN